ncbi:MAG: hypothetical protein NTW52_07860 [Planctomycetota bacterium]|nr:hypothetical protein [Planctomycetota bacterium]
MHPSSPEFIAARHAAMLAQTGFVGVDETDPTGPSGHAYGLRKSAMLTSDYRKRLRRGIVDVTPQEVIDCLLEAGIKKWCLMGLHGYVGYLPMPRATQDVDVMVPYSEKGRASKAIAARWPMLKQITLPQVIRFVDDTDLDPEGKPKPVVDVMLPWSEFQTTILNDYVLVDEQTGSRYPTLEAAVISKYAPLVSPHRSRDKKEQDAVDFRRIVRANHTKIDRQILFLLGNQVWDQGGPDVLRFVDLTLADQPLPV